MRTIVVTCRGRTLVDKATGEVIMRRLNHNRQGKAHFMRVPVELGVKALLAIAHWMREGTCDDFEAKLGPVRSKRRLP